MEGKKYTFVIGLFLLLCSYKLITVLVDVDFVPFIGQSVSSNFVLQSTTQDTIYTIWTYPYSIDYTPNLTFINHPRFPLIILITSKPSNADLRTSIRRTYGTEFKRLGIPLTFIMGLPYTEEESLAIKNESEMHNDLLVYEFMDTYANLSLKTFLALKWIRTLSDTNSTSHFKWTLKADDDSYLNAYGLVPILKKRRHQNMSAYCFCWDHAVVSRDQSEPKSYVPVSIYPNRYFPRYCSGHAYVLTVDCLGSILNYIMNNMTEYFFLEDVLFTGLAAQNVGVQRVHDARFRWDGSYEYLLSSGDHPLSVHRRKTANIMEETHIQVMN